MATKKKTKKATKSKRVSSKKTASPKRVTKKKTAKKPATKKLAAKKLVAKKSAATTVKKKPATPARKEPSRGGRESARWDQETPGLRSAGQSGDLQGLSDVESADSESVDELLEEGDAFEAEAVAGVQHADDEDEREVHTHEVPEDDVPEEYRNQD